MAQAEGAGPTPVAVDWNWTARIKNELNAGKAWQRNWGFLVEQPPGQDGKDGNGRQGSTSGQDSLQTFMQQARTAAANDTALSYIASKQRDSARERRKLKEQDSLSDFVTTYMAKEDPKHARLPPTKEFKTPLTSNHNYGWGRNLEVFGNMTLLLK